MHSCPISFIRTLSPVADIYRLTCMLPPYAPSHRPHLPHPPLQWFGAKVWNADSGYTEMSQQPSTPSTNGASTSTATTATSIALSRDLSEGRKFFMFGGKGGVGKTSLSASLAVKLASDGYPTLIVSTDPAHSLSDCLDYDVSGGLPVRVDFPGIELPLWGMQVGGNGWGWGGMLMRGWGVGVGALWGGCIAVHVRLAHLFVINIILLIHAQVDVEQARKELRDLAAKSDTKARMVDGGHVMIIAMSAFPYLLEMISTSTGLLITVSHSPMSHDYNDGHVTYPPLPPRL